MQFAAQLARQRTHKLQTQRFGVFHTQVLGQTHPVIRHRQIQPLRRVANLDPNLPSPAVGKSMFETIREQFV